MAIDRAAPWGSRRDQARPGARRYLLVAAVAFAVGIAAARLLDLPVERILAVSAAVAAASLAAFLMRWRAALVAGALALAGLSGALDFAVRSAERPAGDLASVLDLSADRPALAVVSGRLEELTPVEAPGGRPYVKALLEVEGVGAPGGAGRPSEPASGRVRLILDGEAGELRPGVRPGARVRLPALFRAPEPPRSPGAMDYQDYAARRGVWATGSGLASLCEPLDDDAPSFAGSLARLRERMAGVVRSEMPPREGALLNTLLIGWRGEMDPEEELAFTRTGTGHLLAVSGIHVMLLVGAVWWALRMLRVPPRWAAAALVVFAVAYAELAGARAPVVRAATMACIFLGGMVLSRSSDGLNSLAAALLGILALWPRELFSAGLQMSFAAVGFIMLVTPTLEDAWRARRGLGPEDLAVERRERWRARVGRYLRLSLFTSTAATLGTMPLIVGCFGLISPWAILVNLVAIPIAGLALALGLVFLTVGLLAPALAPVPAALAWGTLWLLEAVVAVAERLPGCSLAVDAPPAWAMAGFYALALAVLLAARRLGRWRLPAVAALLVLSVATSLSGWLLPGRPPEGARVTVLATRRGAAAVVEGPAGRSACTWAGGGRELADFLRTERLGALDLTVVPADREGLASGVGLLVRSSRAGRIVAVEGNPSSQPFVELLRAAPRTERMAAGWSCRLDGLELRAVGAGAGPDSADVWRPRPVMILAEGTAPGEGAPGGAGGVRGAVLFADLSNGYAVRAAMAEAAAGRLRADVVVLGFAWKPAKGSAELLRACGARVAVLGLSPFEAGEPQGRELARLCRRSGLLALCTDDYGSLRCAVSGGRVEIEHFTEERWWPLGRVESTRNAQHATRNMQGKSGM